VTNANFGDFLTTLVVYLLLIVLIKNESKNTILLLELINNFETIVKKYVKSDDSEKREESQEPNFDVGKREPFSGAGDENYYFVDIKEKTTGIIWTVISTQEHGNKEFLKINIFDRGIKIFINYNNNELSSKLPGDSLDAKIFLTSTSSFPINLLYNSSTLSFLLNS